MRKINYGKLLTVVIMLYAFVAVIILTAEIILASYQYDIPSYLLEPLNFIKRWNIAIAGAFVIYTAISMLVGNLLLIKAITKINENSKRDLEEFIKLTKNG